MFEEDYCYYESGDYLWDLLEAREPELDALCSMKPEDMDMTQSEYDAMIEREIESYDEIYERAMAIKRNRQFVSGDVHERY